MEFTLIIKYLFIVLKVNGFQHLHPSKNAEIMPSIELHSATYKHSIETVLTEKEFPPYVIKVINLDGKCSHSKQCQTPDADCIRGQCQCKDGYENIKNIKCIFIKRNPKILFGMSMITVTALSLIIIFILFVLIIILIAACKKRSLVLNPKTKCINLNKNSAINCECENSPTSISIECNRFNAGFKRLEPIQDDLQNFASYGDIKSSNTKVKVLNV